MHSIKRSFQDQSSLILNYIQLNFLDIFDNFTYLPLRVNNRSTPLGEPTASISC